jgi:hypothetical protein
LALPTARTSGPRNLAWVISNLQKGIEPTFLTDEN